MGFSGWLQEAHETRGPGWCTYFSGHGSLELNISVCCGPVVEGVQRMSLLVVWGPAALASRKIAPAQAIDRWNHDQIYTRKQVNSARNKLTTQRRRNSPDQSDVSLIDLPAENFSVFGSCTDPSLFSNGGASCCHGSAADQGRPFHYRILELAAMEGPVEECLACCSQTCLRILPYHSRTWPKLSTQRSFFCAV